MYSKYQQNDELSVNPSTAWIGYWFVQLFLTIENQKNIKLSLHFNFSAVLKMMEAFNILFDYLSSLDKSEKVTAYSFKCHNMSVSFPQPLQTLCLHFSKLL